MSGKAEWANQHKGMVYHAGCVLAVYWIKSVVLVMSIIPEIKGAQGTHLALFWLAKKVADSNIL